MSTIYLAGALTGRLCSAIADERKAAIKALQRHGNLFYYDPYEGHYHWQGFFEDAAKGSYRSHNEWLSKDLWMLDHSDVVLVLSDSVGVGFECGLAYVERKPIVVVGDPNGSSMLHAVAACVAPTVEEAVEWIAMNLCEPSFAGSDEEPPFLDLTDGYVRYLGPIPSAVKDDDVVVASTEEHMPLPAPFLEYQDKPSPMYDSNKMLKIGGVI